MHVAIIMDGNGRWAEQRGFQRSAGHRAGARAVRRVVEAAVRADVDVLTLYAFSSDNWARPTEEVESLMRLFKQHLHSEAARCVENGVRVNVIGRRDRLGRDLLGIIERTEAITVDGARLTLQLAIDYSSRAAIARAGEMETLNERRAPASTDSATEFAASECCRVASSVASFAGRIARATCSPLRDASVDLLIRTGGERRLSDFLLWECAYAELVFVDACWPDFDEWAFNRALNEFRRRERRFGGLPDRAQPRLAGEGH